VEDPPIEWPAIDWVPEMDWAPVIEWPVGKYPGGGDWNVGRDTLNADWRTEELMDSGMENANIVGEMFPLCWFLGDRERVCAGMNEFHVQFEKEKKQTS
jgi:hypothetical protein